MNRTGVFATAEEVAKLLKASLNTPYLIIGGRPPRSPQEQSHDLALAHGLPEVQGFYGCDLTTGEFVSA